MVVRMTTNAEWIEDAVQKINGGEQEVMLDFSDVARIDGNVVRALEELAGVAERDRSRWYCAPSMWTSTGCSSS